MSKMKLAIVGHGFVGKAVDYGFPHNTCEKLIVDPKSTTNEIRDFVIFEPDFVFVCVPTPMSADGSVDSSIITKVVNDIRGVTDAIIVIKSTVTPDIIDDLSKYKALVYNPEFLTEKSPNEDFVNPKLHVFGGQVEHTSKLEKLYKYHSLCKPCPCFHMSHMDASFVKYGINTFLATKVLWFNQFFDIIDKHGGNYGRIISAMTTDDRVGSSHTTVPGHDGRRGYGSSCFAKDTAGLAMFAKTTNVPFTVLEEVIRRNQDYRTAYAEPLPREKEQNVRFNLDL